MLKLRENAITSILEAAYMNLDQVLKGPLCKQTPPSEDDCRSMILGSYTSFLIARDLYPQRKTAMDVTMNLKELSAMFATLTIRTYESHDVFAIYEKIRRIVDSTYLGDLSSINRRVLIGNGLTEHKTCGEIINIATRAKRICTEIPSPSFGRASHSNVDLG